MMKNTVIEKSIRVLWKPTESIPKTSWKGQARLLKGDVYYES
jgi:hypothetical protein